MCYGHFGGFDYGASFGYGAGFGWGHAGFGYGACGGFGWGHGLHHAGWWQMMYESYINKHIYIIYIAKMNF